MIDIVDDTLRLWRSSPFVWGGVLPHRAGHGDCMLSIGEYIAARGGRDVTGMFRGQYGDEAGALAQMALHGGATGLVDMTGLNRTADPARGDVVVIDTGTETLIGALCTGSAIAARLERGVIEVHRRFVTVVQAWEIPK